MTNYFPPTQTPVAHLIPYELLQLIYEHLSPRDFNSARHACRTWMQASLDKRLLLKMLRRGGWRKEGDMISGNTKNSEAEELCPNPGESTWLLSWRLNRECAILSGQIGSGFGRLRPLFVTVSDIDFTELANSAVSRSRRCASGNNVCLFFNTSTCGRYLLVARDTIIYVYRMEGSRLNVLTSVICPRRVLSMTMDASSDRHSIAALLECRMGMVCELQNDIHTLQKSQEGTSHLPSEPLSSAGNRKGMSRAFNNRVAPESIKVQSNHQTVTLQATNDPDTHTQHQINQTWNLSLHGPDAGSSNNMDPGTTHTCSGTVPIEDSTSTFYRHLCSEDDPPRSVSICPQRLCVAFGCSAGIELHWIDALAGQSLSR